MKSVSLLAFKIQPSTLWKCLNCYIIRSTNVCARNNVSLRWGKKNPRLHKTREVWRHVETWERTIRFFLDPTRSESKQESHQTLVQKRDVIRGCKSHSLRHLLVNEISSKLYAHNESGNQRNEWRKLCMKYSLLRAFETLFDVRKLNEHLQISWDFVWTLTCRFTVLRVEFYAAFSHRESPRTLMEILARRALVWQRTNMMKRSFR